MAKAIIGAALLAGAIALDVATAGAATPFELQLIGTLFATGASMESGAIASALTANRGMNITTRQPASYRQIIYGTQRVGAVQIYQSTTGSSKDQYNLVIVIATHEVWALENLYLDGRQVYWKGSGDGWSVRNGIGFGGVPDGNDHIGPDGVTYNFSTTDLYCKPRYGDQLPGDVIGGLTANDPTWTATSNGSPWVGGCTYVYLKIEYNTNNFQNFPEIKFTVKGKPVFDPRTGITAYSSNPALIIADAITDPNFGLNDASVNQAQLIAAANICDEQVATATAGDETQYACHYHYDTGTGLGDAIAAMMLSCGGRLSRISGEWNIFPASFIGAYASFNEDQFTAPMKWEPTRSFRDLCNRVTGTYVAPNFPFNVLGDLYDGNGYYNGQIQNNFQFAFQPTNFPQFALDPGHGYASDQYLNEDGGVPLVKDINFVSVLSVTQAQRLAKIELMRNRQQGSGTFQLNLAALQLQPCDTFYLDFAQNGWAQKLLEVVSFTFHYDNGGGSGSPQILLQLGVQETDPSVYEWSTTEENTVYAVPATPPQTPYYPTAPTNLSLVSGAATAVVQADGSVMPRIQVTWNTPLDVRATQIHIVYALTGTGNWMDGGSVSSAVNSAFITGIVAGQSYDVQIQSVWANGSLSSWEGPETIVTTVVNSTTTNSPNYHPSSSSDAGAATQNPTYAYDGASTTSATVTGAFTVAGFPGVSLQSNSTLTVIAASTGQGTITAKYGGSTITLATFTAATATATYTASVPAGVILSSISVLITATSGSVEPAEVYIQG